MHTPNSSRAQRLFLVLSVLTGPIACDEIIDAGDGAVSLDGGVRPAADASAVDGGSIPVDAAVADGGAPVVQNVSVDQMLVSFRPEFIDYFWNHLNAETFRRWSPADHTSFRWLQAPRLTSDLGSEVGASYEAFVAIGGMSHELVVTYTAHLAPTVDDPMACEFKADVTIDGEGPFRQIVQYRVDGDDTSVHQEQQIPTGADANAWAAYLQARMTNLASFQRDVFQKDFVESNLTSRGTYEFTVGFFETDITVEQDIANISVEQVSWWWDNMGETVRYRRWHPTAHKRFDWTKAPLNPNDLKYDVGSVQNITETIGSDTTLNIGWLDPAQVQIPVTYDNYLYGSTNLDGTPFGGFLLHEYQALPGGKGVHMKSTFRIPTITGGDFWTALGQHCIQEMQFLQYFLPDLFQAKYHP